MKSLLRYAFLISILLAGICQLLLADSSNGVTNFGAEHPAFCRPDYVPVAAVTAGSQDLGRNHKIDLAENEVEEEELSSSRKNVQNGKLITSAFLALSLGFILDAMNYLRTSSPFHYFNLYRSYIFLRVIRI